MNGGGKTERKDIFEAHGKSQSVKHVESINGEDAHKNYNQEIRGLFQDMEINRKCYVEEATQNVNLRQNVRLGRKYSVL